MQTHQSNGDSTTDTAPKDDFEAFEMALRTLSERVRTDDAFAHDLYGALCNMRWRRRDADGEPVSMSWRYAGGVVSGEKLPSHHCTQIVVEDVVVIGPAFGVEHDALENFEHFLRPDDQAGFF